MQRTHHYVSNPGQRAHRQRRGRARTAADSEVSLMQGSWDALIWLTRTGRFGSASQLFIRELQERGLITFDASGFVLTPAGRALASDRVSALDTLHV